MGSPYQSQSASGYNASPPPDDGTTVAANKITWSVSKTKLADPLKTLADAINTQLLTALDVSHNTTSINYTTLVSDHLKPIEVTGTTSISLGDASTMTAGTLGYRVYVVNKGVATVTVNLANAANTLDGTVNGTQSVYPGGVGIFSVNQARNGYYSLAGMKGNTWAVPGSIGSTTPNAGAFTTLSSSSLLSANAGILSTGAINVTTGSGVSSTFGQALGVNNNYVGIGYNTVSDFGFITAVQQGVGGKTLQINPNGGAISLMAATTATLGLIITSGQTLTLTGATVAGAPTWSSTQTMNITGNASGTAATVTGAAQAAITSVGTISTDFQPLGSSIPQNSQSAAYTTVAGDANKHILHPTADNNPRTFTIDSNANVAYKIGTCITFVNQINTVTIAITTDTMTLAGTATTGSRTLAAGGMATALKIAATEWIISGTGLS